MKILKYLLIVFFAALFWCCGVGVGDVVYEVVYKPRYATRFEIGRSGDTTILVVLDPWQGARGVRKEYRFVGSHDRIIAMSSSHTAFLEALGEGDRVIGVSGRDFMHSETMRNKEDIGYDRNLSYEKIVAMRPDAMTVYEVAGENSSVNRKLVQLGVPVIYISDYLESDPLGRAEWIVAMGVLVGQEKRAEEFFDSIEKRYVSLKSRLRGIEVRPKVVLNSPYRDVWYMPGDSNYMVRLISDAGASYLGGGVPDESSRPISIEKAYSLVLQADYWLNPSSGIDSRDQLLLENNNFKGVRAHVFSNNKRCTEFGGSDFWESGAVRPDIVLEDLVRIFHPELLCDHELYYYRELK